MLPQVVFEGGNPLVQSILEVSGSNPSEETDFSFFVSEKLPIFPTLRP